MPCFIAWLTPDVGFAPMYNPALGKPDCAFCTKLSVKPSLLILDSFTNSTVLIGRGVLAGLHQADRLADPASPEVT